MFRLAPQPFARVLALWLACTFAMAKPLPAAEHSSDMERAEAKAIEAKAFFKSGLYAKAAEGFMQAFAISKKPEMMFNAARAYEEAGMAAESIAIFEQYVKLPDATEDGRKDALARIARQKPRLVQPMPPPPAEPKKAEPPPPEPKKVEPPPEPKRVTPPPPVIVQEAPPQRWRWLSWTLVGIGGFFELSALVGYGDAVDRMNKANAVTDKTTLDSYHKAVTDARGTRNGALTLGILGAGLAGWGAWRLLSPEPKRQAVITPIATPDGAGLALGGSF